MVRYLYSTWKYVNTMITESIYPDNSGSILQGTTFHFWLSIFCCSPKVIKTAMLLHMSTIIICTSCCYYVCILEWIKNWIEFVSRSQQVMIKIATIERFGLDFRSLLRGNCILIPAKKPIRFIWAATWQNQQSDCAQRRLRSAWAPAQSDQNLRCALNG